MLFPSRCCVSASRLLLLLWSRTPAAHQGCVRAVSGTPGDKQPLKKAKTPQGRLDNPEEPSKDVLQKFPDDVNPLTKEKGGPRGPEPTRYGDWERKGRCVDF